jgi:hypothetical protein
MKNKKSYLLVLLVGLAMSLYSQPQVIQDAGFNADTATVNALLQQSKDLTRSDPDKALNLATQAKTLAEKIEFSQGEAYALKSIGQLLKRQGNILKHLIITASQ